MLIKLILGTRKFHQERFEEMKSIFQMLSNGQSPDILFITCSDSRVDPNLITQSDPGQLFMMRNVGNIIPPSTEKTVSSESVAIEYALTILKVKNIIICGHSDCGAMKGLFNPNLKDQLPSVASWLKHSSSILVNIDKIPEELKLEYAIKQNIVTQLEHLRSYPLVAEKLASKELILHGWFYDIGKSEIFIYQNSHKDFISFEKAIKLSVEERKNMVVKNIASEYLKLFIHPKTASEFHETMGRFALLKNNLRPIWNDIHSDVFKVLWSEIGGLYSSPKDKAFIELVDSGCNMPLSSLKDFTKELMESKGYHKYCSQLLRQSGLFKLFQPTQEPILCLTNKINFINTPYFISQKTNLEQEPEIKNTTLLKF